MARAGVMSGAKARARSTATVVLGVDMAGDVARATKEARTMLELLAAAEAYLQAMESGYRWQQAEARERLRQVINKLKKGGCGCDCS